MDEEEAPEDRVLRVEAAVRAEDPVEAERAERRVVPPAAPAEDVNVSPFPENADPPLAPLAEAEVLAKVEPLVELPVVPDPVVPPVELTDRVAPPLAVAPPPPPLLERPPRSEGAINEIYRSAPVTPVKRKVLANGPVCAGAVRMATTLERVVSAFRFSHAQYPAPAATTIANSHTQP